MSAGNKVFSNFLWRYAERSGAQIVTVLVSVILARLLEPEVYGLIAIVTIFTSILEVFVNSGFANALIQKKDADDLDFSTVFYFNIITCVLLYILLFFTAPVIAGFYGKTELTPVLRVMGLSLIVSGVRNIQQAYVSKKMIFRKFFFATLGGTIGAAIVGVTMAYMGCGVWSLVGQQLFSSGFGTVILWLTVKWRPKKIFSFDRLKGLFSYGSKLLAASLTDTIYNDIRQLIIGKMYSTNDLAYYNRGNQFPNLIVNNINTSIDSVLFPTMSEHQGNSETVKGIMRRSIKIASYLIWPLMVGLAVCAEPFVRLVLTDKWLPCVPYLRIFCISYAFYPIHTSNLIAIKAVGRSDLYLILDIIKKGVGMVILLASMWHGPLVMAYSLLVGSFASQIINTWPNKKLLNYSYLEQIKDILPYILLSLFMGACVFCVQLLNLGSIITLIVQVVLGIAIYVLGSIAFKLESFKYLFVFLKKFIGKNDK